MNLQPDSKILFQGITAELSATHGVQMKVYGTKVVAGVNPGLGGQTFDDIPVFDLVEQALAEVGLIDTTLIFVPAYQALDAALEAISAGIRQIIIVSSGMPPLDMVHLLRKAEATETIIVGPNSPGIIIPGKLLLGTHRSEFYIPGAVGIVSRSSTLTYEIALELTKAGLGQSMAVSIGGDAIAGSSFLQWLQMFDSDDATEVIVLVGELGGNSEEAAAHYITETINKPVIAYIAGRKAPAGRHWGHTGTLAAVVGRGADVGTVQSKLAALKSAKIPIAEKPSQIPDLVKKALKKT